MLGEYHMVKGVRVWKGEVLDYVQFYTIFETGLYVYSRRM